MGSSFWELRPENWPLVVQKEAASGCGKLLVGCGLRTGEWPQNWQLSLWRTVWPNDRCAMWFGAASGLGGVSLGSGMIGGAHEAWCHFVV